MVCVQEHDKNGIILTFGVYTPTIYGTRMPVMDVNAPPMPIKMLA